MTVVSGDEFAFKIALDSLGPEKEIIVNLAPAGANTLLFMAAQNGQEDIVEMLIDSGADGRAHAVTKYSPLYTAVHHGHINVTRLLLEKFPELVQQMTVERWLPLHAACINGHHTVIEILLNYSYPEHLLTTYRDPTGEWEWRLPFDPNTQDVTGQTALYVACLLGNKPLVELLLNWRVTCIQTTLVNKRGDSVVNDTISVAAAAVPPPSQMSPTKRRISYSIQSIMSRLSLGRDSIEEPIVEKSSNPLQLNILCGAARETALLAAVRGCHLDVVAILLKHEADPNVIAKPIEDHNDPK